MSFLVAYDREASAMCNNVMNTQWDFNTNITEATKQRMVSKRNNVFLLGITPHKRIDGRMLRTWRRKFRAGTASNSRNPVKTGIKTLSS